MRETLLKRRSEHLNMVGLGVELLEIVKTLAKKYGVSTTAIYIDHTKMHEWAAYVSIMKDGKTIAYVVLNALRRLVPRAWKTYVEAATGAERIGAIREMRSIYMDIIRILINTGKIPKAPDELVVHSKEGEEIVKLLREYDDIIGRVAREEMRDIRENRSEKPLDTTQADTTTS